MDLSVILFLFVGLGHTVDRACSHHCDFEQGTCGWENEADNEVGCSWNVRKGQGLTPDSGPFFDHTYGSPNGTYLYFHSSYCDQAALNHGVSASLQIKGYAQKFICLKFWYQMYGGGSSYQITVSQNRYRLNFMQEGNQGRAWRFTQASINNYVSPYMLSFSAIGAMTYADVAVDDIDIVDGQCEPALDLCDFESDFCGFNVTTARGDFKWNNDTVGNSPIVGYFLSDHTLRSGDGHVAYAHSGSNSSDITRMVSPVQKSPETEQCLSFYYAILFSVPSVVADGDTNANLSVFILTKNQGKVTPAWSAVGGNLYYWEYATVPISLKENYQYSFVATKGNVETLFFVDDVSVQNEPCLDMLSCTFTNGSLCGWTNPTQHGIYNLANFGWMAEESYPEVWEDAPNSVASAKAEGGYAFVDSKYLESWDAVVNTATIASQRLPSRVNGSWCFAFAYRLFLGDNAAAQLSVNQNSLTSGQSLTMFSTGNPTAGMWINVQLDIKTTEENSNFLLAVSGTVDTDYSSRIEVDNFVLSEQPCST